MTVTARAAGDILTAEVFNTKIEAPLLLTEIPDGLLTGAKLAAGAVGAAQLATVPRARSTRSAVQSIPTGAFTEILWTAETWDTDGVHSLVTNTGRFTVVTAGTYLMIANLVFAASAGGDVRALWFEISGNSGPQVNMPPVGGGNLTSAFLADCRQMVAGDYWRVSAYQNSGGALDLTVANSYALLLRVSA